MQTTEQNHESIKEAYDSASWIFRAIALMAVVNAIIAYLWVSSYFPLGLGFTQIIAAIQIVFQDTPNLNAARFALGLVLYLLIVGVFALLSLYVKKRVKWAFLAGSLLYLLDAVIVIFLKDYLALAFHGYFLYRLWLDWQIIKNDSQTKANPNAINTL